MWEYEPQLDRFGTPMALMLLPYWTDGLHRLDGGAVLRVVGHDAVPLPEPDRAVADARRRAQRDLPYRPLDVDNGVTTSS